MREDLKILAKHLSRALHVQVVFEKDACPSTNGKIIILPTELSDKALYPTLGALIHECGHNQHTDFNNYLGGFEHVCLNTLEDIRIDTLMTQQYPNAIEFHKSLFDMVFNDKEKFELIKNEPMPMRVIKTLLILAYGYKTFCQDALDVVEKLNLREYINISKSAAKTSDLVSHAEKLARLLQDKFDRHNSANNPMSQEAQQREQQRAEQRKADSESKLDKMIDKIKESRKEADAEYEKCKKAGDEYRSTTRKFKSNGTRSKKLFRESRHAETEEQKKKLEQSGEKAAKRSEEMQKKMAVDRAEYQITNDKYQESYDKHNDLREEEHQLKTVIDRVNNNDIYHTVKSEELLGFKALKDFDLNDNVNVSVQINKTLDSVIAEFFASKREQRESDEFGTRLNPKSLHKIFTTNTDLFTDRHNRHYNTKVAFVVDESGSMMGKRQNLVVNAVGSLSDALQRTIDSQNLPVEYAVYNFSDHVKTVKDFEERVDGKTLMSRYTPGSYTEIVGAVSTILEKLNTDGEDSEKVMVVITDATVSPGELEKLPKLIPQDVRVMYVGIQCLLRSTEEAELFQDYNIMNLEQTTDVITRALMSAIK